MTTENFKARLAAWRERARTFVQAHAWSLVLLAVLLVGSLLTYAGAGWWHAQIQAAEARGRAQAMAYRAPEPVEVPVVVCPESRKPVPVRRPSASKPAVTSTDAAPLARPMTELDRRLAAFQAEVDKTPSPNLFNPKE